MIELGNIEKVDLREKWKNEALDLTPWLARPENIKILGREIGVEIDIDSIKTEEPVGNFNVDILAQEEDGAERKIIIENQLEPTNHEHLGKLITYASGHDAKIIIWLVKEARSEHKKAIDWLNEHTDEETNFFLIQMELWKIGDSLPAPKFNVIIQPNNWLKEIKKIVESTEITDTRKLQLEFWSKFKEYAEKNNTSLRFRSPRPKHWYDISLGSAKAHISLTVDTREKIIGCEIYIPDSKELFMALESNKRDIEEKLGANLQWMKLEGGTKASRIKLSSKIDITKKETWKSAFDWLQSGGEKFQLIFGDNIRFLEANRRASEI
jgi:Domain of unknown function (DUF4268)